MKLLVNAPTGLQEIVAVGAGGGYFDESRVLWDERIDGELPAITLGGMVRVGAELVLDNDLLATGNAAQTAAAKLAKNAEINASRLTANRTTFVYGGKAIACDELSRSDIDGVAGYIALNASLPPDWPGAWKAADNTYVSIPDVDTFKAMYAAMVAQSTANFAHSQALKATLAAATTLEEINAITW